MLKIRYQEKFFSIHFLIIIAYFIKIIDCVGIYSNLYPFIILRNKNILYIIEKLRLNNILIHE